MSTSLAKDPYDGTLDDWRDVEQAQVWDAVVLGNGMSINVWGNFAYESLYKHAKKIKLFSKEDEALFDKLDIENFEEVLHKLSDAILIGDAIGEPSRTARARHESIQKALAHAVQAVHVEQGEIPLDSLEAIRAALRQYRHVFTTSYDLLVYWAAAKGPPDHPFDGFYDFFWAKEKNAFDESTIRVQPGSTRTRLYFLHGALHLVVLRDGTTCKQTASFATLLNKFERPFKGDHTARPLIVTEARAADKLRSINSNGYLSYCWRTLGEANCPIVVFGHSLSDQDRHLVDALNQHPDRAIAVGIRSDSKRKNAKELHRIAGLLEPRPLYFFDSASHPLGMKGLRLGENPWRKLLAPRKAAYA